MEVIVWVALAVMAGAPGVSVQVSEDTFKTKAECEALNAQVEPLITAQDMVAAYGLTCVEVTVKAKVAGEKKQSLPTPQKKDTLKQKDLEKSDNPAQASEFRSL